MCHIAIKCDKNEVSILPFTFSFAGIIIIQLARRRYVGGYFPTSGMDPNPGHLAAIAGSETPADGWRMLGRAVRGLCRAPVSGPSAPFARRTAGRPNDVSGAPSDASR